ncbi:MAG: hypothetical protein EOM20_16235 [Spartobacteria bacterium]|nr:hypothetical protein [Spartobacteria bacterium]
MYADAATTITTGAYFSVPDAPDEYVRHGNIYAKMPEPRPFSNVDDEYLYAVYRGYSVLSRAIQLRTWAGLGGPSHVANFRQSDMSVIEAWTHGVRYIPFDRDHKPGTIVDFYRVDGMTPDKWATAWQYCKAQLGKPYNYANILWFISRAERADDDWGNVPAWICSQLAFVSVALQDVYVMHKPSYKVSPYDIVQSPITHYVGSLYT